MTGTLDRDLDQVIARGAPPFQRLTHPAFRAMPASPGAREYAARWMDGVGWSSGGPIPPIEPSVVTQAFAEALIERDVRLPVWADHVATMLNALPEYERLVSGDPTALFAPSLVSVARRLLNWDHLNADRAFGESVLHDLTYHLATRILLTSWTVLELEVVTQPVPRWDVASGAWRERLESFPGLAYPIGTAIRQWQGYMLELLGRLRQDLGQLRDVLFEGRELGRVTHVAADLGDRHDDGRAVAVVSFESMDRVVYKPKDLSSGAFLMRVVRLINQHLPVDRRLAHREIVCRAGYGWERYVGQRMSVTRAEARRFFAAFGRTLRVIQLVEARDFWIDNLLIDGDTPVFADLECILHPRLRVPAGRLRHDDNEESIAATAAVSYQLKVADSGLQDFGALSGPGPRRLPVGTWTGYGDRVNGDFRLSQGKVVWEPSLPWPRIDGVPAFAPDYFQDILNGYVEMQHVIRACAPDLSAGCLPLLSEPAPWRIRVLMRNTFEYLSLLRLSLQPTAVLDGNEREISLTRAVVTIPHWIGIADDDRRAIAWSEVASLRRLDIPQFHNAPQAGMLDLPTGGQIADAFAGSGADRLADRLSTIDRFPIERHCAELRAELGKLVPYDLRMP